MVITAAHTSDLAEIRGILATNQLPTADIEDASIQFWVLRDSERIIGCVALQRTGDCGLLRSLVVDGKERGKGYGILLVKTIEQVSVETGVTGLYLLTETAPAFFTSLGYEEQSKSSAPQEILNTREFAALCPVTAVCMRKQF